MADLQKRKNVYAILFFLAILFIAIGLERNGGVEGLAIRQAAYPEKWLLSCDKPDVQTAAEDLGDSLQNYYGCTSQLYTYCKRAVEGVLLPKQLTVTVSCSSAVNKNNFINLCIDHIKNLCNPASKTFFFRSLAKR